MPKLNCRFPHDAEAVAIVWLPEGCYCYPGKQWQALCGQHLARLDEPYEVVWKVGGRKVCEYCEGNGKEQKP